MSWPLSSPDRQVDHDHAQGNADLGSGEADAGSGVHGGHHVVDQGAICVVDVFDGGRGGVQHGVAVLHDRSDRPWLGDWLRRFGGRRRAQHLAPAGAGRLEVVEELVQRVAAELLQQGVGQDAGRPWPRPRLPPPGRRRCRCAPRRPPAGSFVLQVDRAEGNEQGGDRLHHGLGTQLLAVGDPALEPSRAVARAMHALRVVVEDLVVEAGSRGLPGREALADRHRLHRVDRHERLGQPPVEACGPTARSEPRPGGSAADHDLEDRRPPCRRSSSPGRSPRSWPSRPCGSAQRTGLSSTPVQGRPGEGAGRD